MPTNWSEATTNRQARLDLIRRIIAITDRYLRDWGTLPKPEEVDRLLNGD